MSDDKFQKFLDKLQPSEREIQNYREQYYKGEISVYEIKQRAKFDQVERVLANEFDASTMTMTERKLHAILQVCLEMMRR